MSVIELNINYKACCNFIVFIVFTYFIVFIIFSNTENNETKFVLIRCMAIVDILFSLYHLIKYRVVSNAN